MCDVLVRKVLAELANKGNTEYVLPPIIFTTDLDCNGTVYTSHDFQTYSTSSIGDNITLCYYTYDTLQTTNTAIASAFTNQNLDGQSIYLPRRYSGDIEDNPKDFETTNLLVFRSIIIPPQYQTVEIEGTTSVNSTVLKNNGVRYKFRYNTKGPTTINNASSLKFQEMYDLAASSSSYTPLPYYYTSDVNTSIIGTVKRDLVKMGYETEGMYQNTYLVYVSSVSDDTVVHLQYRINVTQAEDVETMIRKSCLGDLLYYGGIAMDRYTPHSPFCDQYMRNYCLTHVDEDACGCFKDEASVIAKSELDKVALPVTCYGPNCSSKNSYKTLAMKQVPCSRMLCKQVIKGIKEAGENVITCNGQYFNHNGQVKLIGDYYNLAAMVGDPAKLSSEYESQVSNDRFESTMPPQPIYVWICLAMAFLIIMIFAMFYMFPPSFFTTVKEDEKHGKAD